MKDYFKQLDEDLEKDTNRAEGSVRYDVDMSFRPYSLVENQHISDDISILTFDQEIDIKAGEFIFLWIPGLGEKPFSVLDDDPFKLVVIKLGFFTDKLINLEPGTEVFVRGPYGIPASPSKDAKIMAVSGGTGLAAVYQLARDFGNAEIFMGARTQQRLYYIDECEQCSQVHVATDDGSRGFHGLVTEMMRERLESMSAAELDKVYFYNCGPEPMVIAAAAIQKEYCRDDRIFNAIDYFTKCGVGICGACNSPDGRRLCVDGPFMPGTIH
jgi:dihydroorotate dehydrogenase (NAD+) catalytic subunit